MRGQLGPRVTPGKYKIRMRAGTQTFENIVEVKKDPISDGSQEDIEEQVALSLELRDAMNTAVAMINDIELIRAHLLKITPELKNEQSRNEAIRLTKVADDIAGSLYDIHLTGAREDAFRSPMKLYGRLSALASDLIGSGIDFKPTDQQGEVAEVLDKRLVNVQEIFNNLIYNEIKAFNQKLDLPELKIKLPIKP
jgi:hypothetical protein